MKIGVNARFLSKPFTGIGKYTRYLFEELAVQNPDDEFLLAVNGEIDVTMPKNVRIQTIPEKFPGTSGMKKTYWEQVQLPDFFIKNDVDLVHFPYPSNPWKDFNKPTVVTVHDTIPWTLSPYRRSLSTRLYQDRCKNAVKKANHVFAVSKTAGKEIVDVCDLDPEKLSVSYNALPEIFFEKIDEPERNEVLRKHGINPGKPFLLYVGGFDARKNVTFLLDAFNEYIAPNLELDLVLTGGKLHNDKLYKSFDSLTNQGNEGKLQTKKGEIKATGFVSDRDLAALYQSSFAFINVSIKEGFNLPLLEAIVSGSPVIASDMPVHHEVVGDYALYCKHNDKNQLGTIIHNLFTDKDFYQKQKQKAESFHCPYSWSKTAKKVMETYKALI